MSSYRNGSERWLLAAALSAFVHGCGVDPEQACEDTSEALAEGLRRCGIPESDVSLVQTDFERAVGGCSNITTVRDEDALYDSCIPSLESLSCAALEAGEIVIDSSCNNQLLR
jgi:hypothetical protein